ncbi:MAG: zinc ABC transporter substrate-binding protein [Tannerellaceae bacterium]|nr:zinc ABC transporter substrate-binding protein [Tannerellaceae bacterium]
MNKMKYISSVLLLFSLFLLSCASSQRDSEQIISVTIEPQRYFAEKIGGDKFIINTVVPSGQSPETFDPSPQQMVSIGKSLAYFQIGYIGFEQAWMQPIRDNNPDMRLFDLSRGIELITDEHDCGGDHHGDEHIHHHHHHGVDPHIWSSVSGAKVIAWNTLQAFIELDPENRQYYWQNYNNLMQEIENTGKEIEEILSDVSQRTFIIYHPALTYFANEYGLTQLCIEMDGKEPSPAQLKELIDVARKEHAKTVFIQQEFDQKNAELIAKETGCKLVPVNPLAYQWDKEMIQIAKALADE